MNIDAIKGDYLTRGLDVETIIDLALASIKYYLYKRQRTAISSLNLAPDSCLIGDVVKALYYRL